MKLLTRVLLAPLLAAFFLIVTGVYAQRSISGLGTAFSELQNEQLAYARQLGSIQTRMASLNTLLFRTYALAEGLEAKDIESSVAKITTEANAVVAELQALSGKLGPSEQEQLKTVIDTVPGYLKSANAGIKAISAGMASTGLPFMTTAERAFTKSSAALEKVTQSVDTQVNVLGAEVDAIAKRALVVSIGLTIVALVLSLGIAWWFARDVVNRLHGAVKVSEAISRGELDVKVPQGSADEVGHLLETLRETVSRLGTSLKQIQNASQTIHSASSEIAAGSQDLSNRTENAASSLEETAASMAELTETVQQSANSARQANQLAGSASQVAERGGAVVAQVVATMQDINDSSRKISEIIGVIDGIAFQTNILALNAAVEAARAGEQGRGFAVVASEVRSLAGRSAEAAKEIKSLISASVEKVEAGTLLVTDAGTTMGEIVASVKRVGDMIGEITSATSEQSTSLAEVNQAVGHLDQMTQQNAALVEESAASSESLREQADRLASIVGQFRLPP